MKRDLTRAQFRARLEKENIGAPGFFGYCDLRIPRASILVSAWNAGDKRREQLRYLIRAKKQAMIGAEVGLPPIFAAANTDPLNAARPGSVMNGILKAKGSAGAN